MIRKGIFFEMGIPASEENADYLEQKITDIVGKGGRDCQEIWGEVSKWLDDKNLRETLKQRLSE